MRLIVGESSTTKILFVLLSSGISADTRRRYSRAGPAPRLKQGKSLVKKGEVIVRESSEIRQKKVSVRRPRVYYARYDPPV